MIGGVKGDEAFRVPCGAVEPGRIFDFYLGVMWGMQNQQGTVHSFQGPVHIHLRDIIQKLLLYFQRTTSDGDIGFPLPLQRLPDLFQVACQVCGFGWRTDGDHRPGGRNGSGGLNNGRPTP